MRRLNKLGLVSAGLLVLALGLFVASCAGEAPKTLDQGQWPAQPYPDYGQPQPQVDAYAPPPDTTAPWPDTAAPKDMWPNPPDSYSATPFGCAVDEDCFGRVCCATPWGVKLCMDGCPAE